MKGVWPAAMQEWMTGMQFMSLGPKMGAGLSAQVAKSGVLAATTRSSATA